MGSSGLEALARGREAPRGPEVRRPGARDVRLGRSRGATEGASIESHGPKGPLHFREAAPRRLLSPPLPVHFIGAAFQAKSPSLSAPSVVMTPHLGVSSKENLLRIGDIVVEILRKWKR